VGLAVLDVIRNKELQENALAAGEYLKEGLAEVKQEHSLIGDIRGLGLFLGLEFVRDRDPLKPADREAAEIVERMKKRGVLLSTDGPFHNVIKIKPPMVFSNVHASLVVTQLDEVLDEMKD
jgi:4-aminobutyrate aminotransferase-like enzyme